MNVESVLEEFRKRRKPLDNVNAENVNPRIKAFIEYCKSVPEIKAIIQNHFDRYPTLSLLEGTGKNKPPNAGSLEEIVSIGLYLMYECSEGKGLNDLAIKHGISRVGELRTAENYVYAAMQQYIGHTLDYLENRIKQAVETADESEDKRGNKALGKHEALQNAFVEFLKNEKGYPSDSIEVLGESEPDIGIFNLESDMIIAVIDFKLLAVRNVLGMAAENLRFSMKSLIAGYIVFPSQDKSSEPFEIIEVKNKGHETISISDFPDYEDLIIASSPDAPGGVFKSNEELRNAFEKFMVSEKEYSQESLSAVPSLGEDEYRPNCVTEVKEVDGKSLALITFRIFTKESNKALEDMEVYGDAMNIYGAAKYLVFADKIQNDIFSILEYEDDGEASRVLEEDFPTYNQLLFASPLSGAGRRLNRSLVELAKDKHGLSINAPCEDYINLQIKKNKRTAAQIHRLNDSDKNIALVLAGYQKDFPEPKLANYMFEGELNQLSGYTNKYPGEKNWLEGKLGHQQLKYKAGVYILRPGVLVDDEVREQVGDLLESAKKNAGGGIIKGIVSKIIKVLGRIATLRSDEVSDVDDLGRETLIDAFADTIIHTDFNNGFTLALMGNWGEGKSSVMEILKRKLKERQKGRFDFALFNAWEYEQTGKTAAGLAQEVVKGLREKNFLKRQLQRVAFAYKENKLSLLILVGFIISPVLIYLLRQYYDPTLLTNYLKEKPNLKEFLDGLIKVAYVILPLFGISIFKKKTEHPLDIKLQTYFKLPDYGEHLGLIPVLKRHITTLCKLKLKRSIRIPLTKIKIGKDRKLLVFVDDLDRCKSIYIAETLDAIRLVMTIPNVIVMICIDHRIAFKAIERHYRTLAEEEDGNSRSSAEVARDYLGKIIQLPVRLEPVKHGKLRNYVYEKLFLFEKEEWEHFEERPESPIVTPPINTSSPDSDKGLAPSTSEEGKGKIVGLGGMGQDFEVATQDEAAKSRPQHKKSKKDRKSDDKKSDDIEIKDRPEEGKEFYRLAGLFEFSNPRQLLRLHNSFRFLKALGRGGENDTLDMLRMLFWQEFLHNWPLAVRHACMAVLIDEVHAEKVKPIARRVMNKVREDIINLFNEPENYADLAEFVRIVVLPHNEEGIFDTKEEINEWLKKQAEELAKKAQISQVKLVD